MKRQICSIQALRALAAMAVAMGHLQSQLSRLSAPTLPDGFVIGAAGVDLFFVISGFVIVYSSERMFGQPSAPAYFFLRRVIRIVPLYFATTTLLLIYLLWRFAGDLAAADASWPSVIASYLFVPFRRPSGSSAPLHSVGWTLNYEMFFYALFAALVWMRRLRAVLCAVALLLILTAFGYYQLVPDPYSILADPIVLEFTYGASIALAYRGELRVPLAVSALLCAVALIAFVWTGVYGLGPHPRWLAWGIPSAMLLAGLVLTPYELTVRAAPLRWLLLLGDASYALYLTHSLAMAVPRRMVAEVPDAATAVVLGLAMITAAVTAAIVVHLYFERPITTALQRALDRRITFYRRAPAGEGVRRGESTGLQPTI